MAAKPWYTSNALIEAVKRKISFPISQDTFEEDDILAFANEEMAVSQVPAVLSYHEEFFVTTKTVNLVANKARYPIPDRAIGLKLRDLFYQDTSGNLYEMTRISPDEKAFFQSNTSVSSFQKYYMEGNDVVLVPSPGNSASGSLVFSYYLRPNQLVQDSRAAVVASFVQTIDISFGEILEGDYITINGTVFTAVDSLTDTHTNEFLIFQDSVETENNLLSKISEVFGDTGIFLSNPSTVDGIITLIANIKLAMTTSNNDAIQVETDIQIVRFTSIPTVITNGSTVDFLQTKPGHKTRGFDVLIGDNAVSGNDIYFSYDDVPDDLIIGDYICLANECIIPQIPSDLHSGLAEKTCARILAALGDQAGLGISAAKIKEISSAEGTLLDNRVEGSPLKVINNKSLLRWGKSGTRRWF